MLLMQFTHQKEQPDGTDRPQRIREHVFLRVPDVSLASEIGDPRFGIGDRGIYPLNDFVTHCNGCNHKYWIRKKKKLVRNKSF